MSDARTGARRPVPRLTLTAWEWKLYLASALALTFTVSWFAVRQPSSTVTEQTAVALDVPVPAMPIDSTTAISSTPAPARVAPRAPRTRTTRVAEGPRVMRIRTRSS